MYHVSIKDKIEKLAANKNSIPFTKSYASWDDLSFSACVSTKTKSLTQKTKGKCRKGDPPIPRCFNFEEVQLIRSLYSPQTTSYKKLAIQFAVSKATIEHVIRGKGAYAQF